MLIIDKASLCYDVHFCFLDVTKQKFQDNNAVFAPLRLQPRMQEKNYVHSVNRTMELRLEIDRYMNFYLLVTLEEAFTV